MISTRKRPLILGGMLLPGILATTPRESQARQATPTATETGGWAEALAINDAGQIVVSGGVSSAILTLDGEVVDLGLGSMSGPHAAAINSRGQVVANRGTYGSALLWEDGQVIKLPMHATDINDAGQVCGASPGLISSVVWADGEITRLLTGPDDRESRAFAINDVGQVVGWISRMEYRPVLWDDGELIELPSPPGKENATPVAGQMFSYAAATGISDAGHIVGMWDDLVVLWRDSEAIVLPMPAGANWSAGAGLTYAVNSAGQVAGTCVDGTLRAVAAFWEDGEALLLPTLPGDVMSWAWGINEAGQVVGMSVDGELSRAVLWEDGEVIDLSAIGRDA